MATRRMFTKSVTDDDHFMEMSSSAQALYLHLSMAADDDGFCNQVSASMFKAHASVSDLETLLKCRYIYQFENGVIVIKHWRMANALRKDRYTQTRFKEELSLLTLEANGAYTVDDNVAEKSGYNVVPKWLPDGCHVVADCLPQVRVEEDSVGKDRLEEDISTGSKEPVCRTSDVRRIVAAWNATGLTQVMKVTAETKRGRALKARIRENGVDGVLKAIENVKNSPFLKGKNKRGFVASFDWLITSPDNFQKTLEGNYTQEFIPENDAPAVDHASEAYQIAQYLAKEKARDNPGRAQPTEAEMQKQATALNELHEQNGVAWETVDNVLYFALNSQWWGKKVQSTYDLKRYFNEIFADMVKEQGAVKE